MAFNTVRPTSSHIHHQLQTAHSAELTVTSAHFMSLKCHFLNRIQYRSCYLYSLSSITVHHRQLVIFGQRCVYWPYVGAATVSVSQYKLMGPSDNTAPGSPWKLLRHPVFSFLCSPQYLFFTKIYIFPRLTVRLTIKKTTQPYLNNDMYRADIYHRPHSWHFVCWLGLGKHHSWDSNNYVTYLPHLCKLHNYITNVK